MKKTVVATLIGLTLNVAFANNDVAKPTEPTTKVDKAETVKTVITEDNGFKASVLIDNLNNPWDMVWGGRWQYLGDRASR